MATLTIELSEELMDELNEQQVSNRLIEQLVEQAIRAWLRYASEDNLDRQDELRYAETTAFTRQFIAENRALFQSPALESEPKSLAAPDEERLVQMEQAANDSLYLADLQESMSAFTEVDSEWWERPE